jgi:hypothetical protein
LNLNKKNLMMIHWQLVPICTFHTLLRILSAVVGMPLGCQQQFGVHKS